MNTNTNRPNRSIKRGLTPALLGAALLATLAGTASAQRVIDLSAPAAPTPPSAPAEIEGGFHGTYTVMSNGQEVNVDSDGKTAVVNLNGKKITTLDLSGDWTRYEVESPDGDVVATVLRPSKTSRSITVYAGKAPADAQAFEETPFADAMRWNFSTNDLDAFRSLARMGQLGGYTVAPQGEQPKVMIGVFLGNVNDEDQAAKAGLDPDKVTEISGVVDDGPAEKAGLRAGDIITSIDGSPTADLQTIRDTLSAKEPGDTLKLQVLRDGKPQNFSLTLEAYNSGRFSWNQVGSPAPLTADQINTRQMQMAELNAQLKAMADQLAQASGTQADAIRERIRAVSAQIAELNAQIAQNPFGELRRNIVVVPTPPAAPGQNEAMQMRLNDLQAQLDDKLAEIDKRLDEMDARIDRKLNELVDQLVQRMRDRTQNPQ